MNKMISALCKCNNIFDMCLFTLLVMIFTYIIPSQAETIIIGSGTGILWEGLPFSVTMSGSLDSTYLGDDSSVNRFGLLAISDNTHTCLTNVYSPPPAGTKNALTNIAGYQALQIAPGVGLIPRASGSASYTLYGGKHEVLTGTIGLPRTGGQTNSGYTITTPVADREWCIPPRMNADANFYSKDANRIATLAGSWVLVADGSQINSELIIPTMYAASYAKIPSGDRYQIILPSSITLRISTLSCTVATATTVNFGNVQRNSQSGTELAKLTYPLITSCVQPTDMINANINVQFRAISGNYNSTPSWLSLKQGGGYITGEIDNGVTGSGICTGTSGIPFDKIPLKVGNITSAETSKTTSNNVTWRLCSGGYNLPTGDVDASAEMLVTFN